jgi:hypothetical protein
MFRLVKFASLKRAEKKLFFEAVLFVSAVRVALWLIPFRWLQKSFMKFLSPKAGAAETDWSKIEKICGYARRSSRLVPFATCLTQALAALYLLRLHGHDAELKIGVKKAEDENFGAHAWLEKDGRVLIGKLPKRERYIALNNAQERIL